MEEQSVPRKRTARTRSGNERFREKLPLLALCGIALLSFCLNFYGIGRLGYGNAYYAAAIRSMTQSWHNFFYISFDPAGLVSVDKPPVGLWAQALFVMVFGYHGWAMLLPQALAGAASSVMMYVLTAKRFGRPAGLTASLVFALTPAVVVSSRNNTIDMQLILVLLVAAWFLFRAVDTGRLRDLFFCAAMIGLGFNIKMLQAYMILPSVGVFYLLCSKQKMGKRLLACLASLAILGGVSFAWTAAVDLTPASERPYVGSSTNNTEWQLIFGHNGMERVSGGMGGMARGGGRGFSFGNRNGTDGSRNRGGQNGWNNNMPGTAGQGNRAGARSPANGTPPANGNNGSPFGGQMPGNGGDGFGGGRGTAVGNDIGTAGPFRLWQQSMYGQASWLLIPALFCILACLHRPKGKKLTPKQGVLFFWIVWLAAVGGFFSFAAFYHRYYLCMLAPGIAGVAGIGFPEMLREFRERRGWRQWLMPLCTLFGAGFSAWYVWTYYEALRATLFPVIAVAGAAALALMAAHLLRPKRALAFAAAGLMGVSLLAGSFYWSLTATLYVCENVTMPYAGPELAETAKTPGMTANQGAFTGNDSATQKLEDYLVKHYKTGSYLVVGQRANDVAQFIVDTGLPAVASGGFLGTDNALTLARFKQLVQEGKITYVMVSSGGGMGGSSELVSYVEENAVKVDASEYGGGTNGQTSMTLYRFGADSAG